MFKDKYFNTIPVVIITGLRFVLELFLQNIN